MRLHENTIEDNIHGDCFVNYKTFYVIVRLTTAYQYHSIFNNAINLGEGETKPITHVSQFF